MILGKLQIPLTATLSIGLVDCWEFDEASGNFYSNNSNEFTANNALYHQTGKTGYGIGIMTYNIGPAYKTGKMYSHSEGTISVWASIPNESQRNNIFGYGDSVGNCMYLCADQASGKYGFLANTNFIRFGTYATGYKHLVITSSGSVYTAYINGTSVSITVVSGSNNGNWWHDISTGGSGYTCVGYHLNLSGASAYECPGGSLFDQLAVWNRVLTPAEISQIYNSGNGLAYNQW